MWEEDAKSDTPNADSENVKFLLLLAADTSLSPLADNYSVTIVANYSFWLRGGVSKYSAVAFYARMHS
jgi:hypothetical protein